MELLERYIRKLERWKDRLEEAEELYKKAIEEDDLEEMQHQFHRKIKFTYEIPMIEKFIEELNELKKPMIEKFFEELKI